MCTSKILKSITPLTFRLTAEYNASGGYENPDLANLNVQQEEYLDQTYPS